MAVKWIIRELEQVEYPGTQLQYGVFDETGKMVSAHHEKEDAEQMAAFPLMLEALEMLARHRINHLEREGDDGLAREELTIIQAAIAAAEGT